MKVLELSVSELKQYEKNPRKNEAAVQYVANSIREFGFKVPIVIDKDNVIVSGHTRLKAAMQLGMETVPCIVADDLTEEQVKAFRLADNRVSEKATWDWDMLGEELNDLFDFDMTEFGFDPEAINIDWDNVEELTEETYEEPKHVMLRCPHCNHVDSKAHFVKVDG